MIMGDTDFIKNVEIDGREERWKGTALAFEEPHTDFLYKVYHSFMNGDIRKRMLEAQKYYANDNTTMSERKIYYIDRLGHKKEAKNLSNTKLRHPHLRKFVNQKVNYLLSKPFSIHTENKVFQDILDHIFDVSFRKTIKNTGKRAIINGVGWIQVYYDANGKLKIKGIPSEEIIPFWRDAEHTELEAVLRMYTVISYGKKGECKEYTYLDFYTEKDVWHYILGERGLEPCKEKGCGGLHKEGHFYLTAPNESDNQKIPVGFGKVPFIAFKHNEEETELLKWIKDLIDDYDITRADTSNLLKDVPNSIKVVKNYDGTDKQEFTQNLATFRTAFVSGDNGDMKCLETPIDIEAREKHLERLRRDMYEGACAVDTQNENLGDASGVSLKFRYADVDGEAQNMASEFAEALDTLVWFIKLDLINRKRGNFMEEKVSFVFNTDIVMNEMEAIEMCRESVGLISDETIRENHPWITNAQEEWMKMEKERQQREILEEDDYSKKFHAEGQKEDE